MSTAAERNSEAERSRAVSTQQESEGEHSNLRVRHPDFPERTARGQGETKGVECAEGGRGGGS